MWNIDSIKKRKRQILTEIKNCMDKEELEKLEITLSSYISMLDNSGTIRNTKFYNLMDKITKGNFSLIRPSTKYLSNVGNIVYSHKDYLDKEYLNFLLQLMNQIVKSEPVIDETSDFTYQNIPLSNERVLKTSKLFYQSLGDEDIYKNAKKIIEDETALHFSDTYSTSYAQAGGITFYDYVWEKVFCSTKRSYTLFDFQACNHEIMHGIDFYFNPKLPTKVYYGFHEIPTYTIDYLFIDYLEKQGFDKEEVQKLRMQKDAYLQGLAFDTKCMIQSELVRKNSLGYFRKYTGEGVMEIINHDILNQLLEIQSGVVAYGLHKQFNDNFQLGMINLKNIMSNLISKDKKPDFSNIALSDEKLLLLSSEIGLYSKEYSQNNIRIR